jgi:hypothetical protein
VTNRPEEFEVQPFDTPQNYELRVEGRLGAEGAAWFEDLTLETDETKTPVQTIIRGAMRDQAALYGLISRIRDLGLTLLSMNPVERKEGDADATT